MSASGPLSDALLLGAIQGVTEFLPVSSEGHLALAHLLFGIADPSFALTVAMRTGTLVATVLLLRRRIAAMAAEVWPSIKNPGRLKTTLAGRDLGFVLVAMVPVGILGLLLRRFSVVWADSPLVVAVGFFATAAVLVASRWAPDGADSHPPGAAALFLGIVQGLSVFPGLSRSGFAITAALFLGVRKERAFELSMLLSLPAVAGATFLEAEDAVRGEADPASLMAGGAVAFGIGLVSLSLLRYFVLRGKLSYFAVWVMPVACATLALAWAWPVRV